VALLRRRRTPPGRPAAGTPRPPNRVLTQLRAIRDTYRITARHDRWLPVILLAVGLGAWLPFIVGGLLLANNWTTRAMAIVLGLSVGLLAATVVFGRRAEASAFARLAGQPGAAAAVLTQLRRGWYTTPTIAVTKSQDIVHRVVGRPGVILVGEGATGRIAQLLATEHRRTQRLVGDVPIHELTVGNGAGEVPLRSLTRRVMRLPKTLNATEAKSVKARLDAVSAQPLPVPKGPLPRNLRGMRGMR